MQYLSYSIICNTIGESICSILEKYFISNCSKPNNACSKYSLRNIVSAPQPKLTVYQTVLYSTILRFNLIKYGEEVYFQSNFKVRSLSLINQRY